jgi:hypothetical protein
MTTDETAVGPEPAPISMTAVAAAIVSLLVIVAVFALPPLRNVDWAWQLEIGERILTTKSIPTDDIFCWSTAGKYDPHPRIYFGWCVLLAVWHSCFGLQGLVVLRYLLIAALACSTCLFLIRRRVTAPLAVFLPVVAISAIHGRLMLRPHIISFIAIVLLVWILVENRTRRDSRLLMWVPPLFVAWANFHSGCILALLMFGVVIFGEWLHARFDAGHEDRMSNDHPKYLLYLVITWMAAAGAICLTPAGWDRYTFIFDHRAMVKVMSIIELRPLQWQTADDRHLVVALLLLFFGTYSRQSFRYIGMWFGLAFYLFFMVRGVRFHPYPFLLLLMITHIDGVPQQAGAGLQRWRRLLAFIGLGVMACQAGLVEATRPHPLVSPGSSDPAAVVFITQKEIPEPLYNTQNFGGYITHVSAGRLKTYRDGRQTLFRDYAGLSWDELYREFGFKTLIVATHERLSVDTIPADRDWALVYFSDYARVYVDTRDPLGAQVAADHQYDHVWFERRNATDGAEYLALGIDERSPEAVIDELKRLEGVAAAAYFTNLGLAKAYLAAGDNVRAAAMARAALGKGFTEEALAVLDAASR